MSDRIAHSPYDTVPYPAASHSQTHPRRLATIAAFIGLDSADIHGARVLELGSAEGANLIPMAFEFPEATFVGVERSVRQIEQARGRAAELGLSNITLTQADILDVTADLGTFDYIIVHGVYSWVPHEVREKILAICKENLSPRGVAYVSYNTYPGWHMRGMLRDMMLYHVEQFADPNTKLQQARALVKFLADSVSTEGNPYGIWLKQELKAMSQWQDGFLYHGPIAEVNEPCYFHQFMERASHYGLQYLGESEFASMVASNFGTAVNETLSRIGKTVVATEQYMDFVRNRIFRQTLLCHEGVELQRKLTPQIIEKFSVCSQLKSTTDTPDLASRAAVDYLVARGGKHKITSAEPIVKAALWWLEQQFPQAIPFGDLLEQARRVLDTQAVQPPDTATSHSHLLGEALLNLFAGRFVELVRYPYAVASEAGRFPRTTRLIRKQAQEGPTVSNLRHETLSLDVVTQEVTRHLDGQHDRNAILELLVAKVDSGVLVVRDNKGQALDGRETVRGELAKQLDVALNICVRGSLLVK